MRLRRRHPQTGQKILQIGQNLSLETALAHTWAIKLTFLHGAQHADSWLPSTQIHANESKRQLRFLKLPKEYADSLLPQA